MRNLLRFLAVSSMVAALTVSGFSKPGNGNGGGQNNGGGHGHGGHGGETSGTYTVGSITCTDSRILDLTGDYAVVSDLTTVALSIVQDKRGRLVASTDFITSESTTSIDLHGHLQLTAHTNLRVQMNGGDDDELSTAPSAQLRGTWNGTAFDVVITLTTEAGTETFTGTLTPVNPLRGFSIAASGAARNPNGKGPSRSNGDVTLPWGTEKVRLMQQNKGTNSSIKGNTGNFGLDLRGSVDDSTTFTLSRGRVRAGYGNLNPETDSIVVVPAVQTAP